MNNQLTTSLDIQHPIVLAPMGGVAGGELAMAVSNAGGLGMIGGGYCDPQWIEKELQYTQPHQFGIGFITWQLMQRPEVLTLALQYQPKTIMLSFGDVSPFVSQIKAAGASLICQVQTVAQALEAKAQGADIIVAQGGEAGGHGASRGTFALVPAVVDAVGDTPVIAAGGIADGRGLAASLMLGAQGVLIGTRFCAAEESLLPVGAKQVLVTAKGDDTVKSNVCDFARGYDWPQPYTGRTIKNKFVSHWLTQENLKENIDEKIQQQYSQATLAKDYDTAAVFAGECLDMVHEVMPSSQMIDEIMGEADKLLAAAHR